MSLPKLKRRKRETHKGDYGHIFVLAGSTGMTGAAFLCCEAAILSGAGLVTLGIPKSLNLLMERKLTEQMTLPLAQTREGSLSKRSFKKISEFAKKSDVLAIGPGLSTNIQTQGLCRSLISSLNKPMVIDADALNAIASNMSVLKKRSDKTAGAVITPHPGEMARLIGKPISFIKKNKKSVARSFASEYNVTTVLKGYKTTVASPGGTVYTNSTGNPGMASGGVGDILTGIIAALLASGMDNFKAARLGTYIHGLAGDIAAKSKGEISLRATDLLSFLPQAFKKVYRQ
ncbi:NAD(P)H-hydrate dehydratase [Candidatus Omnitrophota bacterium]